MTNPLGGVLGFALLDRPLLYRISQKLWYRRGKRAEYVRRYIRATSGCRILDIGCGDGAILEHLPSVSYLGFDPNPVYVAEATRRYKRLYGSSAKFVCAKVPTCPEVADSSIDIVTANGVLHHLSNEDVSALLLFSNRVLKKGGRLVTIDGCFSDGQGRLERLLMRSDRGSYVRDIPEYENLISGVFNTRTMHLRNDMLRLPYTLIIFECTK